jgi:hypothetical protein
MSEGIKETKEVIVAANEIALLLVDRLKDGAQVGDVVAVVEKITQDQEFKDKLSAAFENIQKVPAELADLDFIEGGELAVLQLSYLPKYKQVLTKAAPSA